MDPPATQGIIYLTWIPQQHNYYNQGFKSRYQYQLYDHISDCIGRYLLKYPYGRAQIPIRKVSADISTPIIIENLMIFFLPHLGK